MTQVSDGSPVRTTDGPDAALVPDLSLGGTWPSLETFRDLARDRRVIPVVRRFLADGETPIGVYRKLADDAPGTFLLESAEHGGVWSRYSIVGAASRATLTSKDGVVHWLGEPPVGVPTEGDPLLALRDTVAALRTPRLPGLPPLTGGMVGFVSWDAVRRWERVPDTGVDELGVPELSMSLATDLAVLDHSDGTLLLVANAVNYDATDERVDEAWSDAVARLDAMTARLAASAPSTVAVHRPAIPDARHRTSREDYLAAVAAGKEAIRDGEVFQVVLAQRFDVDCPADALDVYRILRASNPSPYMYLYRAQDAAGRRLDVVGSSPEALVKVHSGRVITHPIAGTRWRGATAAEDNALAEELLADEKERAEHLMLVDLARNDLGRVCVAGSVEVVEFMTVERYSHVMHLVSVVEGNLAPGRSAYDVLQATFPAGTLSGAPKPRAMELIDELEPVRRGLYGGVVGYFDVAGDMDLAIAIRTALLRDGVAHVQAGAGIVADSVPEREDDECRNKAAAVLRAVATAAHHERHTMSRLLGSSKRTALLAVLVGAAVALFATTRTWATGTVGSNQLFTVTGGSAAPGITALALVCIAGAVVLATAGRGVRRIVALAVALAGLGAAVLAGVILADPAAALRPAAEATSGTVGADVPVTASLNAWPLVALVAALLIAVGGLLALVRGGGWSGPSARYERPAEGPGSGGAPTAWDALSRGDDPTV